MIHRRIKKQRCYLAGAMDRVSDRGATWRDEITPMLENMGISVLNPLKKPSTAGIENEDTARFKLKLKKTKDYDNLTSLMKEIRAVDLRLVDISDFLIVNLDLDVHPCGTYEEIFWANRQKKPIIIRMVQGKTNAPDWLFGTIPHQMMFSNWTEIMDYLIYINTGRDIEHLGRWCFFEL